MNKAAQTRKKSVKSSKRTFVLTHFCILILGMQLSIEQTFNKCLSKRIERKG